MKTRAKIESTEICSEGMKVTLVIEGYEEIVDQLNKLMDCILTLELKKYREGRSLTANAYFWKLCDIMAKALKSDKNTIYLMMLERYGVFADIDVKTEASGTLAQYFRLVKEEYRHRVIEAESGEISEFSAMRCYKGSHEYDSKEMSDLISGTVNEATDMGLPCLPEQEIYDMVKEWKGVDTIYGD